MFVLLIVNYFISYNLDNRSSSMCSSPVPMSPCSPGQVIVGDAISHIQSLKCEVQRLKSQLILAEKEHEEKMKQFEREEKETKEQNIRLQRKLQIEMERREQLCRHLR